jgi:hypothetical protein
VLVRLCARALVRLCAVRVRRRRTEEAGEEGAPRGFHIEDERRPRRKRELEPADAAGARRRRAARGLGGGGGGGGRRRRGDGGGFQQLDDERGSREADGRKWYAVPGAGLPRGTGRAGAGGLGSGGR